MEHFAGGLRPREHPTRSNEVGGNPSSTKWWNGVPRGTMDEVSSRVRLDLPTARSPKRLFPSSSDPMMEDAMGRRRGYCIHRSL